MTETQAVLCYVDGPWAYFTTRPLAEQWGDDWNDAPYEHNAGRPYEWRVESDGRWCRCVDPKGVFCHTGVAACGKSGHVPKPPKDRWEIVRVAWSGPFETPADRAGLNSAFSVEQINRGDIAWLLPDRFASKHPGVAIRAGTPLAEFVSIVTEAGGTVYLPARRTPEGAHE